MDDNELLRFAELIDLRSQIEDILKTNLFQVYKLVYSITINQNHNLSVLDWAIVNALLIYALDKFFESNNNKEQE